MLSSRPRQPVKLTSKPSPPVSAEKCITMMKVNGVHSRARNFTLDHRALRCLATRSIGAASMCSITASRTHLMFELVEKVPRVSGGAVRHDSYAVYTPSRAAAAIISSPVSHKRRSVTRISCGLRCCRYGAATRSRWVHQLFKHGHLFCCSEVDRLGTNGHEP